MSQRKLLEERRSCSIKQGSSHSFTAADDFDQLALVKRFQNRTTSHTANLLDLCTPDWLSICDDSECLQCSSGKSLRSGRELRALDCLRVFRPRENLPAACNLDELDSVLIVIVVMTQLVQRFGHIFRLDLWIIDHSLEIRQGDGMSAREERCF